jgi:hypothetical protein
MAQIDPTVPPHLLLLLDLELKIPDIKLNEISLSVNLRVYFTHPYPQARFMTQVSRFEILSYDPDTINTGWT